MYKFIDKEKTMNLSECKGEWALVTGASSGIGREFCAQLAAGGVHLVMVARRQALLQDLAAELTAKHAVQTLVLPVDLGEPGAAEKAKARVESHGITIRLLVNNAAAGHWGHFGSGTSLDYERMIMLNAAALISLCRLFLSDLGTFKTSAVINVSSPAALQPVPYMAVYAASKSFVHSFSQALYGEWRARGIYVQTLVPGPTATEFDAKAGAYESALTSRGTAAEVVTASLAGLAHDRPLVVVAKGTYKQRLFAALFPAKTVIATVARMFRPPTS